MALDSVRHGPARSLKQVNEELKRRGINAELRKGLGYFYFSGPDCELWKETSVMVTTLSQLSVDQWMSEWDELKNRR